MEATAARAAWQACRAHDRCHRGAVGVTGADIVRISRTLAVHPWTFTQTAPASIDEPAGIVVERGRRRVTLTLANAAHGCVFLVQTASGASCCGLGDLAPVSCRLFPDDPTTSELAAADPVDGHPPGCRCPERTGQNLDGGRQGWAADQEHWLETIARWNRQFGDRSAAEASIEDFQRYLLEAQAAREAGAVWPEEVTA